MEKLNNWITSEDQLSVNLNKYDCVAYSDYDGTYSISFEGETMQDIAWEFDKKSERDTAYKNIQKIMVNIDYK